MRKRERTGVICLEAGQLLAIELEDPPTRRRCWSFPGGKVEAGETPAAGAIRETREDNKLSEEQFKQILAEQGMSLEKYREQLKDQMKKMRLLDQEIKSKVQVTKKEIDEYHKGQKDKYNSPPEVRLQQILLMIPAEAGTQEIDQIKGKAEGILQKIKNGEDFNAMVKLHSQDSSAA